MPEDQYFRPRNWEKFQHYGNRQPPWIKLHRQLLRDYDFLSLTETQQAQLIKIWLLYADYGRPLPLASSFLGASLGSPPQVIGRSLKVLISSKFIELCSKDASAVLAPILQEVEKEIDTEEEKETPISPLEDDLAFAEFWSLYPRQRRGGKQKACSAWKAAITRASAGDILLGLRAYCASDEVKRGFAKGAAAWLNDDRWTTDYVTFREQTTAEQLKDWVDGDERNDSGSGTIDGEYLEVPDSGPEGHGNGLLPCSARSERRGHTAGDCGADSGVEQGDPAQAGGSADDRSRLAALTAKAAKACKT